MVQPRNDSVIVENFLKTLDIDPNAVVKITVNKDQLAQVSASSLLTFPEFISVNELFSYWLALLEPPSRYFMKVLSHFVDDPMHKAKLQEFSSKTVDGKSEYHRYAVRERRTVPEVLADFYPASKCKLPLAYLIQLCGKQKPREFSISSMVPGQVHLTMAVTEYETPFKR